MKSQEGISCPECGCTIPPAALKCFNCGHTNPNPIPVTPPTARPKPTLPPRPQPPADIPPQPDPEPAQPLPHEPQPAQPAVPTDPDAPNLITCTDCRHQISPAALYCPHCGRPIIGPTAHNIEAQLKFMHKRLRSIDANGCVVAVIHLLVLLVAGIAFIIYLLQSLPT